MAKHGQAQPTPFREALGIGKEPTRLRAKTGKGSKRRKKDPWVSPDKEPWWIDRVPEKRVASLLYFKKAEGRYDVVNVTEYERRIEKHGKPSKLIP